MSFRFELVVVVVFESKTEKLKRKRKIMSRECELNVKIIKRTM